MIISRIDVPMYRFCATKKGGLCTLAGVVRHHSSTETTRDQALAVALMMIDLGECVGWVCEYLPYQNE